MKFIQFGDLDLPEYLKASQVREDFLLQDIFPAEDYLTISKLKFNLVLRRIPEKALFTKELSENCYQVFRYFPVELSSNQYARYGKDTFFPEGSLGLQYICHLDSQDSFFSEHNLLVTHFIPYALVATLQQFVQANRVVCDNFDVLLDNYKVLGEETFIKNQKLFQSVSIILKWKDIPGVDLSKSLYKKTGILDIISVSETDFLNQFFENIDKFEKVISSLKKRA